jgi:hypothetical protein
MRWNGFIKKLSKSCCLLSGCCLTASQNCAKAAERFSSLLYVSVLLPLLALYTLYLPNSSLYCMQQYCDINCLGFEAAMQSRSEPVPGHTI